MVTLKQLEALYWVVKLNGFAPAAHKLHTTQSAVSKRVQELEGQLGTPLFDRTLRSARLTERGEQVFATAQTMLAQADALLHEGAAPAPRRIRIGVTEVTAMTWLPRFVATIYQAHPNVMIDPDVNTAVALRDKLLADEIDLMIAADGFRHERFKTVPVGHLRMDWMCKPGLLPQGDKPLRVQALQGQRILTQGPQSGTGVLFNEWFQTHGLKSSEVMVSNSLLAAQGLTLAGFGITYLPVALVRDLIDNGLLQVLNVRPMLPLARYAASIKLDNRSELLASVVRIAQETCDFERPLAAAVKRVVRKKKSA